MNVSEIMTPNPVTIQQDATLHTALETMERVGCHHLLVVSQRGTLVGLVSADDCRQAINLPRRHWEDGTLPDRLLVSTVMTFAPVFVGEDTPAEDAVSLMLDKHVGCLPVMRDHEVVSVVTTSDVLRVFTKLLKQLSQSAAG